MKILNDSPTKFYKGQRRYIRIESDALSTYHDSEDLKKSKFNFIINGNNVKLAGSTPLREGRLRLLLDCDKDAKEGSNGELIVELSRFGLPILTDKMDYAVVEKPITKQSSKKISVPRMILVSVEGPQDPNWQRLEWPENESKVASSSVMDSQLLTVYYSRVFPPYAERYDRLSKQNASQAQKFHFEYKKWIALHSILLETEKNDSADSEDIELREQEEKSRLAILACMSAEQYVTSRLLVPDIE